MRVLKSVKSWKSVFTCSKCGNHTEMYHSRKTKKEALKDIPSKIEGVSNTGVWNGWFVADRNKELCPICYFGYFRKNMEMTK